MMFAKQSTTEGYTGCEFSYFSNDIFMLSEKYFPWIIVLPGTTELIL